MLGYFNLMVTCTMLDKTRVNIYILSLFSCLYFLSIGSLSASFYQPQTLAKYCQQYIKYSQLEKSANQLEAGICSGYVASTIELMDLSGRLCKRDQLNLDTVITRFIAEVESSQKAKENSATFVLVDLLQNDYACE